MAPRRPLIEGFARVPTPEEQAFIEGRKSTPTDELSAGNATHEAPIESSGLASEPSGSTFPSPSGTPVRAPISTKTRADYAAALKRASLERQLAGIQPNTLQELLEDAVGPWLKANSYIS